MYKCANFAIDCHIFLISQFGRLLNMWVSTMISLIFWCAIGSVVGSDSAIGKRDVSELIGKSDQSQLARTSSRLTNRYLPPQSGVEYQHTQQLTAPVDISSKSGDLELVTATSEVENSHHENHSLISNNELSQSGTNQLRAEFKSAETSANGAPSTIFKSSEVSAPQYDTQYQFSVNGTPQTKSAPETQGQISVNGEFTEKIRENEVGLALQRSAELNNRNSESPVNYLPPQSQTLPKPIHLTEKLGDIGTSYISPINDRSSEQLFTNNPESSSSSSSLISQQLPARSFEPNSFSQSTNAFKTYGPPSFQQQRPGSFSSSTNAFKTYGSPNFQQQRLGSFSSSTNAFKTHGEPNFQQQRLGSFSSSTDAFKTHGEPIFQQQRSDYSAPAFNGGVTKDVEFFQPVPTEQTKLAGANVQPYNYEVPLQNRIGQTSGFASAKDMEFLGSSVQLLQQKSQFGYDAQGTANLNGVSNFKSDNGYKYSEPQNYVGAAVLSNYQQNDRASSSSLLTPTSISATRFTENIPQLEPLRSTSSESRSASLHSANGYQYQNPDFGIAAEGAGNQQISDYQSRPDYRGVTTRQNFQVGVTPDLLNARLNSNSDSSYPITNGAAYKYVRPANGLGVQNLETRFQPQSQPLGVSEVSQRVIAYDQPTISRNSGSFGIENGEDLENVRLRSGSDSSYTVSNGAAYKYIRPAIGLGTQNLARIQPEVPQNQALVQRINTYDQPSVGGNGRGFGSIKDEDFSGQGTTHQSGSGQSYDSSGAYVY